MHGLETVSTARRNGQGTIPAILVRHMHSNLTVTDLRPPSRLILANDDCFSGEIISGVSPPPAVEAGGRHLCVEKWNRFEIIMGLPTTPAAGSGAQSGRR